MPANFCILYCIYFLRATRGNRTRRLLCTKQVPRLLGLGGNGGEGGTRTRIDRLQGGGSSFELHPQISAGCEGIEPSRRSFGGSAVTMTLHPMWSLMAPAHPRRFELPSLDRQSSCVPVAYGRIYELKSPGPAGFEPASSDWGSDNRSCSGPSRARIEVRD